MNTPIPAAPTTMTRFNLYIDAEMRRQLEQLSAQTGAPMGEIVRRGVVAWIQQQQQNERPC